MSGLIKGMEKRFEEKMGPVVAELQVIEKQNNEIISLLKEIRDKNGK